MFLECKLVRFQLLFVIISLTIAGEKICSHLAKFILLCRAALESTYLLTGAYILGVHEILTPCVIKQHFSIHCQVSHKVRISALQCNKELSSQPNGNFAAYIWWWDTVQLDYFTCFHMSLLSSTSRVLIPLSLRMLLFWEASFTIESGLLCVKQALQDKICYDGEFVIPLRMSVKSSHQLG